MKNYGFPKYLRVKLRIICVMMMASCLGEFYTFSLFINFIIRIYAFQFCLDSRMWTYREIQWPTGIWRAFAKRVEQNVSSVGVYEFLITNVRLLSHWQIITLRHCIDAFIITVRMILTMRFGQICRKDWLVNSEKSRMKHIKLKWKFEMINLTLQVRVNTLGYEQEKVSNDFAHFAKSGTMH